MNHKAFCSALQIQFQGVDIPVVVLDSTIVMDSSNNIIEGETQITVPLVYSDSVASIRSKIIAAIRASYDDPHIQVVFLDSDVLNLL